jgi:hypothetical protein
MMTEADWKARMAEKAKETAPRRMINEALLRQASVKADVLTGHPEWDTYLQSLQVRLDEAIAQLQSWQEQIIQAHSDADLRKVQGQILIWTTNMTTIRECMRLPKEILAHAHDTLDK